MSIARIALSLFAVGGLCHAATPSAIASKVTSTLQGKNRVGIVCDYSAHQKLIREVTAFLDPSIRVVVVDSHSPDEVNAACNILRKKDVDCLLVLPSDPLYAKNGLGGKRVKARMKELGLPVVNADQL